MSGSDVHTAPPQSIVWRRETVRSFATKKSGDCGLGEEGRRRKRLRKKRYNQVFWSFCLFKWYGKLFHDNEGHRWGTTKRSSDTPAFTACASWLLPRNHVPSTCFVLANPDRGKVSFSQILKSMKQSGGKWRAWTRSPPKDNWSGSQWHIWSRGQLGGGDLQIWRVRNARFFYAQFAYLGRHNKVADFRDVEKDIEGLGYWMGIKNWHESRFWYHSFELLGGKNCCWLL